MNPLIRLHSIVISVTTLIIFSIWELLASSTSNHPIINIALTVIASVGAYRLLILIIKAITLNIRFLKKLIFGTQYIEGVWVGFFIGKSGNVRYYIEIFEQDFESITIKGKGYRDNDGYFCHWTSESVYFNDKKGTLNYTYTTDTFSDTFINSGFAIFIIDRKNNNAPPYRLSGFSADLHSPIKMKSLEEKIDDKPNTDDIENALDKAKQLYLNNKYFTTMNKKDS